MQTLNRGYRDLEAQAGTYGDPDRAWQDARRRRTRRRTGVVAGLLGAVLLGSGVVGAVRLADRDQTATPAGVPTVAPPGSASDLPTDRAVGAGAMVYAACRPDCPAYLLTKDGHQYVLGKPSAAVPGNGTLSPDGRWLGQPDEQGYTLRQLDDTLVVRLPFPARMAARGLTMSPWAWSQDSRTLVLGAHRDGRVIQWTTVTLPTGSVSDAPMPEGYEPVGFTDGGEPVLLPDAAYSGQAVNRLTLRLGGAARPVTLTAPESVVFADADHGPWVRSAGDRLLALTYVGETVGVATYTLDGALVDQSELSEGEAPLVADRGGLVLLKVPLAGQRTATVVRLAGGAHQRLIEVPPQAMVVWPGQIRG